MKAIVVVVVGGMALCLSVVPLLSVIGQVVGQVTKALIGG